jgi:hypothetical protein
LEHGNQWKGDDVGYAAMHNRLHALHGSPNGPCYHCGTTDPSLRYEWAYTNNDPNEKVDDKGRRYSTDMSFYVLLCVLCHNGWMDIHLHFRGEIQWQAKLTNDIVHECRERHDNGETWAALGREFGVKKQTMWEAGTGKTWKHVK